MLRAARIQLAGANDQAGIRNGAIAGARVASSGAAGLIQTIRAVSDALRKISEEMLADGRTRGIQSGKQKRRDIVLFFSLQAWEEAAARRTSEERHDR